MQKSGKYKILKLSLVFLIVVVSYSSANARVVRNGDKISLLASRIIGRDIELKKWELEWVRNQAAAISPKRNYLIWLKNVKAVTNPDSKDFKVFYIGIGPYIDRIDVVSPILATDYSEMIAIDKQRLDFYGFKRSVTLALANVEDAEILGFEQLGAYKYSVEFMFNSRKRTVIAYYNSDADYIFPQELKSGYDMIYTRWMGKCCNPAATKETIQVRNNWLKYLNRDTGFLTVDGEYPYFDYYDRFVNSFWDNFTEVPFEGKVPTVVISNARRAHLFVLNDSQ